ncbi:MAG: spore protease [Bacillota bacterium]|nr:spore protease [Bacillota bacterium]
MRVIRGRGLRAPRGGAKPSRNGPPDVIWDSFGVRTDLAVEAREFVARRTGAEIPGVLSETERTRYATITRVKVVTEEAERALGKVRGNYVTIESPHLRSRSKEIQEDLAQTFAREFLRLAPLAPNATVLVAGLGNWQATPDALGPRTVEYLTVTRHLHGLVPPELRGGMRPVCAIAPGVLGLTGIETGEIIRGVVSNVRPDLVVVVDALASMSTSRLGTTIQMGDTGIRPGSGVGNKRLGITRESLGVPVVAVGVPTVVAAETIALDAMEFVQSQGGGPRGGPAQGGPGAAERRQFLRQALAPYFGALVVTPKEIDDLVEDLATVVAGGLNAALHPSMDWDRILAYLS